MLEKGQLVPLRKRPAIRVISRHCKALAPKCRVEFNFAPPSNSEGSNGTRRSGDDRVSRGQGAPKRIARLP